MIHLHAYTVTEGHRLACRRCNKTWVLHDGGPVNNPIPWRLPDGEIPAFIRALWGKQEPCPCKRCTAARNHSPNH